MCGIVGYIGPKRACDVLIEGLKRLEYRGYDSAGVCVYHEGKLHIVKSPGRISEVEKKLADDPAILCGTVGIAHTRWATHGEPNEANAHPHCDGSGRIALVHNGIIENYAPLKKFLIDHGHVFRSETDTEVLAQLIGRFCQDGAETLEDAVRSALREVSGTYGIAVMCAAEPDKLVVARKGSPLIMGVGSGEYIVASDASAILEHTTKVVYLNDNEMAVITRDSMRTMTLDNVPVTKEVEQIEWSLEQIAKGGYEHFMLKEIFEQPEAVADVHARAGGPAGHADPARRAGARGGGAGADQAADPHRLRHGLARGAGGRLPLRGPGPDSHRGRVRQRVPLPQPDHRGRHDGDRHQPVRRDGRHAGGAARGQGEGRAGRWASSTWSARPSPARPTRASTCTPARRSAWPPPRRSPASWWC